MSDTLTKQLNNNLQLYIYNYLNYHVRFFFQVRQNKLKYYIFVILLKN